MKRENSWVDLITVVEKVTVPIGVASGVMNPIQVVAPRATAEETRRSVVLRGQVVGGQDQVLLVRF
jgi:hypothetical protein